ncbi:MAG: DNA phosphorothioation-associated protein 4 [Trichloromonadaceae bacterium]
MSETCTIAEVAKLVMRSLGKPVTVDEIYSEILRQKLYTFNTPTPEHVLRTTIRRHTGNVERVDVRETVMFEMVGDELYGLAEGTRTTVKKRAGVSMKRIQRANDKEEIIKALMSEQVGVFKEIWKLLLFAAQIGLRNNKREPLNAVDTGKGIDQSTFGNCPAWPGVLYLMTLAESGSSECLSGSAEAEDNRSAIFQEYANGGLNILNDFFSSRQIDLDGLLSFIDSQKNENLNRPDLELTI